MFMLIMFWGLCTVWQHDVLLTFQMTLLPTYSEASPTDNCHMLQNPNKINIYSRHTI